MFYFQWAFTIDYPILAMSRRLVSGDKDLYNTFRNVYGVPSEVIESFNEPANIARFFHQEIKQGMKEMGFSIDWRREFTTIDEAFSKFISWQFNFLKKKGFHNPRLSSSRVVS